MDQFLAGLKRVIIQGIDWLFWAIALAWQWTFGQISRALGQDFKSLPDWKALLYIALVLLVVYMAYLIIPRLVAAFATILRAIWSLLETLLGILVSMVWYIAIAYGLALVLNTFKGGAIFGKMPWQ